MSQQLDNQEFYLEAQERLKYLRSFRGFQTLTKEILEYEPAFKSGSDEDRFFKVIKCLIYRSYNIGLFTINTTNLKEGKWEYWKDGDSICTV